MEAPAEGLEREALDSVVERIQRDADAGWLPAAQIAIGLDGEIAFDRSFGCGAEARFPLFSVSKVLTAAAAWRLIGTGALTVGTLVVDVLPWFTGQGKERVRLCHLMEHTAGFPNAPLGPPEWFDPDARRARIGAWRVDTEPGTHMAYHATAADWVVAEMVSALTGRPHTEAIHELVTEPMGLPPMLGVDDTECEVIDVVAIPSHGEGLSVGEVNRETLLRFNDHRQRALGVPGGGGYACARHVAVLYQNLLHDPGQLFDPDVLRLGTAEMRVTMLDELRGIPANRTLGLVMAGDDGQERSRGFGKGVSPAAFGHDGANGQIAWADPASGLSMCFLTNAMDGDYIRQQRRSISVASHVVQCRN